MNTNSTFFLCLYILFALNMSSQETKEEYQDVILHLLSGDTVIYKLSENKKSHVTGFQKKSKKDLWKFKIYSENDIAFYATLTGEKTWMYQTSPKKGQFLKPFELEQYVLGKRDAKFNYRPNKHFIGGILFGLAVSGADTYQKNEGILSKSNSILSISTPLLSSMLLMTKKIRIKNFSNMEEQQNLEYHYSNGYNSSKKAKNHIASFTGSLLGVIVIFLLNNN